MRDPKDTQKEASLFISAEGLKGKQSVRATFRLPSHVIELLGLVATQLGLKQKSLFDQLIEDEAILDKVAEKARQYHPKTTERRQKTFVLSKRSLTILETVARQQQIPRDVLVEISIRRLLPVIDAEQERHKKRSQVYAEMEAYLAQGKKILAHTGRLLGPEDQVYEMARKVVDLCETKVAELREIVVKGQSMEDFEI